MQPCGCSSQKPGCLFRSPFSHILRYIRKRVPLAVSLQKIQNLLLIICTSWVHFNNFQLVSLLLPLTPFSPQQPRRWVFMETGSCCSLREVPTLSRCPPACPLGLASAFARWGAATLAFRERAEVSHSHFACAAASAGGLPGPLSHSIQLSAQRLDP